MEIFKADPKGPGLASAKDNGVTFARGIRPKHTGFLIKKIKGSNCDAGDKEQSGRKAVPSDGEFQELTKT